MWFGFCCVLKVCEKEHLGGLMVEVFWFLRGEGACIMCVIFFLMCLFNAFVVYILMGLEELFLCGFDWY